MRIPIKAWCIKCMRYHYGYIHSDSKMCDGYIEAPKNMSYESHFKKCHCDIEEVRKNA